MRPYVSLSSHPMVSPMGCIEGLERLRHHSVPYPTLAALMQVLPDTQPELKHCSSTYLSYGS